MEGLDQIITVDDLAFSKYLVTCHMEVSDYKRWCHYCPNCAQAFIHFLAMGWDPFRMGFEVSMLSENKKTLFSLSKKPVHDSDDYHSFIREEEALAFLFVHRHGAKGPLMDRFQKEFILHTERNETEKKLFQAAKRNRWGINRKRRPALCTNDS